MQDHIHTTRSFPTSFHKQHGAFGRSDPADCKTSSDQPNHTLSRLLQRYNVFRRESVRISDGLSSTFFLSPPPLVPLQVISRPKHEATVCFKTLKSFISLKAYLLMLTVVETQSYNYLNVIPAGNKSLNGISSADNGVVLSSTSFLSTTLIQLKILFLSFLKRA